MKAIFLREHGGLEQVEYGAIERPVIGPNEVLLQVRAAALNRVDLWVVAGWKGLRLNWPHILGSDGAGVVEAVGERVVGYAPGDRVAVDPTVSCGRCSYCRSGREQMCDRFALFGEHVPGFYAEYQAVPARNLTKMPAQVTFETAAAASLVYVTAWHSLISVGGLQTGEDVLIIGAAGGANSAYIDIARLAGAGTIYVVGSSEEKLEMARRLGANITVNRHNKDWGKVIFEATQRRGVDIVVDNVGAATFQTSLRSLRKGGRLLTVGNTSGAKVEFDNRYVFGKHLQIIGTTMGPHSDYEQVMELVFNGRLNPVIDAVYPMSEGLTALHRLDSGDVIGKLVLRPGS